MENCLPQQYFDFERQALAALPSQRPGRVKFLYTSPWGFLVRHLVNRASFSRFYGWLARQPWSTFFIRGFVQEFAIPLNEYVDRPYQSFNDFFRREFHPGARPLPFQSTQLLSPAEGFVWAFAEKIRLPIKGQSVSLTALIHKTLSWKPGAIQVIRLTPREYHRVHFPQSGRVMSLWTAGEELNALGPEALSYDPEIFIKNKRVIIEMDMGSFGKGLLILVGATYVGAMQLQIQVGETFIRGDEAGYFELGGSTVVLVGERGKWKNNPILEEMTNAGLETFVKLYVPTAGPEFNWKGEVNYDHN